MTGMEMLLAEFDEKNLPDELSEQFKILAFNLKNLPAPRNLKAIRGLLDIRGIAIRANNPTN